MNERSNLNFKSVLFLYRLASLHTLSFPFFTILQMFSPFYWQFSSMKPFLLVLDPSQYFVALNAMLDAKNHSIQRKLTENCVHLFHQGWLLQALYLLRWCSGRNYIKKKSSKSFILATQVAFVLDSGRFNLQGNIDIPPKCAIPLVVWWLIWEHASDIYPFWPPT